MLVETSVWLLTIITIAYALWNLRSEPILSFLGFTIGIFFIFILPKSVLYHLYGNDVFLAQNVGFEVIHINAALIAICLFVIGITLSYSLPIKWIDNVAKVPWQHVFIIKNEEKSLSISNNIFLHFIFPVFLIALVGYIWAIYDVGGQVFHKTKLLTANGISHAYIMQKMVQIVKIGVYLYFLQIIASNTTQLPKRSIVLFGIAIISTTFIFLISGHRSGIILLFIQVVLFSQYMGWICTKHLFFGVMLLVALNIFILLFREATESTEFYIVNLLRRYFFEIEKIAGLIRVTTDNQTLTSPWDILDSFSLKPSFEGSSYYYLGHKVLNSKSAVGPTILGDVILYMGGIFILPMAIFLGYFIRMLEKISLLSSNPITIIMAITTVAVGEFILLNTDTWAFIKRIIFELGLLSLAFLSIRIYVIFFYKNITNGEK
jgi:hypothetical protein